METDSFQAIFLDEQNLQGFWRFERLISKEYHRMVLQEVCQLSNLVYWVMFDIRILVLI